jgi:hypothetical protein
MALLVFIFGLNLWAAELSKSIDIVDPAWGKFTIRVEDAGKPVTDPIRVDVTLLCNDQRPKPTSVLPAAQELLDHDKICAFDKYAFDRDKKILTVQITTSETVGNEAKCQKHMQQTFELKKLCANWKVL